MVASLEIDKTVAKVEKLVAMSASPQLEEARTAAYLACRLIREHSLCIGACEPIYESKQTRHEPQNQQKEPRLIRVRHQGYCKLCRDSIFPGEMAYWIAGGGLWHSHCNT
jgi:hypothetical protein